jgi:low affinity Fe/Cu permease
MKLTKSTSRFTRFAKWTARPTGHPSAFVFAVLVIVAWALTGTIFGFSDTWQPVINTHDDCDLFHGIQVFLIQNTQKRDSEAIQVQLDELIRLMEGAHNAPLNLEELDENGARPHTSQLLEISGRGKKALNRGSLTR